MRRARVVLAALLLASACGSPDASDLPRGEVTIQGTTISVEIAATQTSRAQGLSGRTHLAPGHGLLFLHDEAARHGYWMKDMHFAIDILWLRDGRIVDIVHRAQPEPAGTPDAELRIYQTRVPANAVLEVPGGYARTHGWDVGTRAHLPAPH